MLTDYLINISCLLKNSLRATQIRTLRVCHIFLLSSKGEQEPIQRSK